MRIFGQIFFCLYQWFINSYEFSMIRKWVFADILYCRIKMRYLVELKDLIIHHLDLFRKNCCVFL
jgi:hypothetical protein